MNNRKETGSIEVEITSAVGCRETLECELH
jgi:hypothetical protein